MVRFFGRFAMRVDVNVLVAVVFMAVNVDLARQKELSKGIEAQEDKHRSDTCLELCFDRF